MERQGGGRRGFSPSNTGGALEKLLYQELRLPSEGRGEEKRKKFKGVGSEKEGNETTRISRKRLRGNARRRGPQV